MNHREQWERRLGWAYGMLLIAVDRIGPVIVRLAFVLAWLAAGIVAVFLGPMAIFGWLLMGVSAYQLDRLERAPL